MNPNGGVLAQGRLERNVRYLEMIMFWKKKEPVKAVKAVKRNELTITMRDKSVLSWEVSDWSGEDKIKPWRHFYKWFFGRTGDVFVMRYRTGETMFRRADISSFTVQIHTAMVDA